MNLDISFCWNSSKNNKTEYRCYNGNCFRFLTVDKIKAIEETKKEVSMVETHNPSQTKECPIFIGAQNILKL